MRLCSLQISTAILALASLVLANTHSDVINLTAENFEASVAAEPLMLVEFFAPGCILCEMAHPLYEEAATTLKERNIKLAKVDCAEEAELCQRMKYSITRYKLKMYRSGTPADYTGPRKAERMVSYMIKQSLPAVSEVTPGNHEAFTKIDKVVVVAYLSSSDFESARIFRTVAENHRYDFVVGLSTDSANAGAANVKPRAMVVYRTFDEPRTEIPLPVSGFSVEEIEDWLTELSTPVIDQVDNENYNFYLYSRKPLAYLFLDPTSADSDKLLEALRPIAQKFRSEVNFVWMDFKDAHEAKWPAFVIHDLQQQLKYPIDQSKDITAELVSLWTEQFIKGELEPFLKSALIPETQDESVYVVVGNSFKEVVFDDSKDVFIEFYNPRYSYPGCKRLQPIWDSLGNKYAPFKNKITIAKMDVMENELHPSAPFDLIELPLLKFKPVGSRDFIDYEADHSLESLIAFVEEHATKLLEIPGKPVEKAKETLIDDPDAAQNPMNIPWP